MLITCPTCAMSYEVNSAALGEAGRSVRCSRCHQVWFATPTPEPSVSAPNTAPGGPESLEDDEAIARFRAALTEDASPPGGETMSWNAPVDPNSDVLGRLGEPGETNSDRFGGPDKPGFPPAGEPTPLGNFDPGEPPAPALPEAEAPPLAPSELEPGSPPTDATPEPMTDIEALVRRRARRAASRRRFRRPGLPAVILGLLGLTAAMVIWRTEVVRHAPQMASLYELIGMPVNLRGLLLTDVRTTKEVHDGVPVLVVEGTIVSAASRPIELPRLRFAVRNESGSEIYSWTAMPSESVLEPGQSLPFRSRLASPPPEGRAVMVRFYNRRDAAAGTH
jgi:predicted Zn finger-like uncharacterized protein